MIGGIPLGLRAWLEGLPRIWLFLDYDGTLVEFSPTPENREPEPQVVALLNSLSMKTWIKPAVISGRTLSDLQLLLPVPGVILAGVYGLEIQLPSDETLQRVDPGQFHTFLNKVRPEWQRIVAGKKGFFLEEKGMALALHAKYAQDSEAESILQLARDIIKRQPANPQIRVLGGHKFLEIAPALANKGQTVSYLMDSIPIPDARPLYIGDDDKDEEAFETVHSLGGKTIQVMNSAAFSRLANVDYVLDSPLAACQLLEELCLIR